MPRARAAMDGHHDARWLASSTMRTFDDLADVARATTEGEVKVFVCGRASTLCSAATALGVFGEDATRRETFHQLARRVEGGSTKTSALAFGEGTAMAEVVVSALPEVRCGVANGTRTRVVE